MVLFGVPDIRLFWSEDARFLGQFRDGDVGTRFEPFSKYPPSFKDVSFWLPEGALAAPKGVSAEDGGDEGDDDWEGDYGTFHTNEFSEVVRTVAGEVAESVELIDCFQNPNTRRVSHCWRVAYRSLEKTLTTDEAVALHTRVTHELERALGVEIRDGS